jgi:histidine decarboxylase
MKDQNYLRAVLKDGSRCEGCFAGSDGHYIFGINFSVAKAPLKFSHKGSSELDGINAFDLAEVAKANLGQINMMTVSSFCGPKGTIWGYDICSSKKNPNLYFDVVKNGGKNIPVFDVEPLNDAFTALTGSIDEPVIPFLAGSHVPCAAKWIVEKGKTRLYSALGLGIPKDRKKNACLIMEDVGVIPLGVTDVEAYKKGVLVSLSESILAVGKNQKYEVEEMFLGINDLCVDEGEIGCALIACPYFLLPERSLIKEKDLSLMSIQDWQKEIKK